MKVDRRGFFKLCLAGSEIVLLGTSQAESFVLHCRDVACAGQRHAGGSWDLIFNVYATRRQASGATCERRLIPSPELAGVLRDADFAVELVGNDYPSLECTTSPGTTLLEIVLRVMAAVGNRDCECLAVDSKPEDWGDFLTPMKMPLIRLITFDW